MKEYLFLLRGGTPMSQRTEAENKADMQDWNAYMGKLHVNGTLVGGLPLVGGGKTVSASGTSNEAVTSAKEGIVGGYMIIKAEDLDAATKIAAECPHLNNKGNIEVREMAPMPSM